MTRNVKWHENLKNGSEGKEVLGIALESRVEWSREGSESGWGTRYLPCFPNCATGLVEYNALNSWFVSLNVIRAKNRYLNVCSAWDSVEMNSPTYAQPFLKSI